MAGLSSLRGSDGRVVRGVGGLQRQSPEHSQNRNPGRATRASARLWQCMPLWGRRAKRDSSRRHSGGNDHDTLCRGSGYVIWCWYRLPRRFKLQYLLDCASNRFSMPRPDAQTRRNGSGAGDSPGIDSLGAWQRLVARGHDIRALPRLQRLQHEKKIIAWQKSLSTPFAGRPNVDERELSRATGAVQR